MRIAMALLLLAVVLAGAVVLRTNHPHEVSAIPDCPSQSIVGVYCPGCGSLRATHHLLNGRITESLAQNPITLIFGVPVLAIGAVFLFCWSTQRPVPAWLRSKATSWALLAIALLTLAFGVVRNIDADWAAWMIPADQRPD